MPGFLIPADLKRMIPPDVDPFSWAEKNLRASPGVGIKNLETGEVFHVPTLRPARGLDKACIFLRKGKCSIHRVAPFECAFFDCRNTSAVLRQAGILAIHEAQPDSLYHRLWCHLDDLGLRAIAPNLDAAGAKA
jgi:hypothetical protein